MEFVSGSKTTLSLTSPVISKLISFSPGLVIDSVATVVLLSFSVTEVVATTSTSGAPTDSSAAVSCATSVTSSTTSVSSCVSVSVSVATSISAPVSMSVAVVN